MAVDDPPLPCIGNVHVPGCEHFPLRDRFVRPERVNDAVRLMTEQIAVGEEPRLPDAYLYDGAPTRVRELRLRIEIGLTRRGRRRCPICRLRRELFALDAFSTDQPVGYGEARCLECAGLRRG